MDKLKDRYDNSMHGGAPRTRNSLDIQLHLQTMRLSDKMNIVGMIAEEQIMTQIIRWRATSESGSYTLF